VFAPLTAWLIDLLGWRTGYLVLAGILAAVTLPLHALFLNRTWTEHPPPSAVDAAAGIRRITRTPRFLALQITMALATLAFFSVTINLIPLLLERGMDYATAALALGLVGAGQVIGRLGYAALDRTTTPRGRTVIILATGAGGLWALALVPGPYWLLITVAVLVGAARGCHTLLQATAVSDRWGTADFAAVNAVFTAPMTAVGALAPVTGPALAGVLGGYPAMAVTMALLLAAAVLLAVRS
jgi:predicted MFS family arabinose efflux permease